MLDEVSRESKQDDVAVMQSGKNELMLLIQCIYWLILAVNLRFTAPLSAAEHFRLLDSGVKMPATRGCVGTVSGDLLHSTQDVSVH